MSRTILNHASEDGLCPQSPDSGPSSQYKRDLSTDCMRDREVVAWSDPSLREPFPAPSTSRLSSQHRDPQGRPKLLNTTADLENAGLVCAAVQPPPGCDDHSLAVEAYTRPVPKPTAAVLTQVFEAMIQAGWT
ncbi:hypothetical protein [Nocardia coubleae]|uniref:Uncharacterized protein n=1 Tax=Nocardia coubleae TaxID=356147 RepID=A0A846W1J8_9NOCA|nr:hypothetical protein [Nocardia coubleae]NKX86626.1 hypothetical protein [Nocardia coubleae]